MLSSDDIDQLAAGSLELRFTEIQLHRCGLSDPQPLSGPGLVRQTELGDLALIFFPAGRASSWLEMVEVGVKAGELSPETDYYNLEAMDCRGRRWQASRIRVNFAYLGGQVSFAEATLTELMGQESNLKANGSVIEIRYRSNIDFPFTLPVYRLETVAKRKLQESADFSAAEFSALGCDIFVRQDPAYLLVSATTKEPLFTPNFEDRIHEALEFILARRLSWATVAKREGANLTWRITGAPIHQAREQGRMQLPIVFTRGDMKSCKPTLDLLSHFLTATGRYEGEARPALAIAVRMALDSSHSPLDAHALDLGVAVETLLTSYFGHLGEPSSELVRDLEVIRSALSELDISKTTKKRVGGFLSSIQKSNAPKDKLHALINQRKVTKEALHAWNSVRHKAAHGVFLAGVDQKYFDAFFRTMALFYRIVFLAIGYSGPFQDYGSPGWPLRERDSSE